MKDSRRLELEVEALKKENRDLKVALKAATSEKEIEVAPAKAAKKATKKKG